VLNGLRHNKPRPWEVRALGEALAALLPPASQPGGQARWLDVLPCTGIVTERLARERPGYRFEIVERTREVAEFAAARTVPRALAHVWRTGRGPDEHGYALVSCLFRLENCAPGEREELLAAMARWVAPQGRVLLGFVNSKSFHDFSEWLRSRRGGPRGVEYVLAPDPGIGPFEALEPRALEQLARNCGLLPEARFGCQAVPPREEVEFRARNFSARSRKLARALGWCLERIEWLPGLRARRGRFQFLLLRPART
jgi:hypothetical protein